MTDGEVEAFLVLYECHSISRAAERLYISQSALSLRIRTLEDEIGAPLFLRGKGQRSVEPTLRGQDFYALAVRYSETVRSMKRLSSAGAHRRLRVCCFDSVNHYLFRPVYEAFTDRCPDAVLEMQDMPTGLSYHSVLRGETDLVFTPGMVTGREIRTETLFTEEMVFLCSENSDYPETVALSDLSPEQEVFIEWFDDLTRWRRHVFGEDSVAHYTLAETGNLPLFLKRPGCWMLAPATVARGLLRHGGVTTRKTAFFPPRRTTNCLSREADRENPLIEAFMACLRETLEGFSAEGLIEPVK